MIFYEADKVKDGLVRIRDNSHYSIAKLTHSIPYLTDGAARKIEIRGRIIELKRTVPGNFAYRTALMPILIQALKAIGKENITAEHKKQLLKLLSSETDQDGLKEDIAKAPQWIKKLLKDLNE